MFHLGFVLGDLRHEVLVLGLVLLVFGPVGVAEMGGAVQGTPWDDGVGSSRRVNGGDRLAWAAEVPGFLEV
ncbi:hypothetical protein [Streptomyces paludis]|uniref:Uncharacterized protein n=1 Tax=Streptomyces paludis TaxID=2282738 RepID=A0A345HVP4_9ACTN|nr:hypothetical protein [Streptomyces paludis]AXG80768.1 hypothetical protein DVK44_27295 [Streptomyces paludis]